MEWLPQAMFGIMAVTWFVELFKNDRRIQRLEDNTRALWDRIHTLEEEIRAPYEQEA